MSFHTMQSNIQSVMNSVVEQVLLGLLSINFIGEMLDVVHIAELLDSNEATNGLYNTFSAMTSFMEGNGNIGKRQNRYIHGTEDILAQSLRRRNG